MTTKIGKIVVIAAEREQRCTKCGKIEECRPTGPKGRQQCWNCTTPKQREAYGRKLFGGNEGN